MLKSLHWLFRPIIAIVLAFAAVSAWAEYADTWGPEIGAEVPAFELVDSSGQLRDLDSLATASGLILFFTRSADW